MGERKGQNFYYPPDFDYKKHKNLNKYHGTHALRERAKKISQGILIIRSVPIGEHSDGKNAPLGDNRKPPTIQKIRDDNDFPTELDEVW
ncbi:hypothetical protein OSTOST_26054 [Ostertagia ostertagi]